MPIRQGGKLAKNLDTCSRRSRFRSTAFPRSSIPCTCMTFFARSIPTVVIFITDAPIRLSGNQHFHFGTSMPFRVGASGAIAGKIHPAAIGNYGLKIS